MRNCLLATRRRRWRWPPAMDLPRLWTRCFVPVRKLTQPTFAAVRRVTWQRRRATWEIVARLLEHSPDLTRKDWDHATPLDIAIFCNHERIAIMLIEAGAPLENRDRLLCRAAVMSVDVVRALLKHGVVVSELRDVFESTPIHKAASGPFNPGLMSMLVDECGIDLNSRDSLGDTCCHVAAYTESDKQLRWFIEAGADCELVNDDGETPLLKACTYGCADCVLLLVVAGANVRATNSDGGQCSSFAWRGFRKIVAAKRVESVSCIARRWRRSRCSRSTW
jgi:ankyrin repeat protein